MPEIKHASLYNLCYSNWHWRKCYSHCSLANLDSLWVEVRRKRIIAICDIKEPNSNITDTEKIAYDDLLQHYQVYIIWPSETLLEYTDRDKEKNLARPEVEFLVMNWRNKENEYYSEREFIKWTGDL